MRRNIGLRLAGAVLGVVLTTMPAGVFAAEPGGLDVVLVMDSSGSMKHTDPQELRKPAARLLVSLLGKEDRVAVVSFSDQGYPVAYLTSATADKTLFPAIDRVSSKGALTNLLGAVEAARRVLAKGARPEQRRLIVLMSDGRMDLGNPQAERDATARLLDEFVPQLKGEGVELHTIAFTEESDRVLLERLAQSGGGRFYLARSDSELHEVFTALFEQNKAPDILPFTGERFHIDPAVSEVTIIGSKEGANVRLTLLSPSGKQLSAKRHPPEVRWQESQQFDLITMPKPETGDWALQASAGKNRAYVLTDLKLQLHAQPAKPAPGDEVAITAWLEEKGVLLTKEAILPSVKMQLTHTDPHGKSNTQAFVPELTPANTPSGQFGARLLLKEPGHYELHVVAAAPTFERERGLVFNLPAPTPAANHAPAKPVSASSPPQPAAAAQAAAPLTGPGSTGDLGLRDAALIFVGFNGLLALLAGGAFLTLRWRKRRAAKIEAE